MFPALTNSATNQQRQQHLTLHHSQREQQLRELQQQQQQLLLQHTPQYYQHQQTQQQELQQLQLQQQQRSNKRSASMIFRIEHLLPSTSRGGPPPPTTIASPTTPSTTTTPTPTTPTATTLSLCLPAIAASISTSPTHPTTPKRPRLRAPFNGVLMSQLTPKDTVSEAIPSHALMSVNNSTLAEQQQPAYCTLDQGVLRMSSELLRRIKLSEDIHSYNALFELQPGGLVHVRTVRDVARDEELVAWFGEDVALLMSIPFLTPLNIQGNKRYTCHLCHLTFETPNPLKIHLALGCGRQSMDLLWIRLHYALKASSYAQEHRQLIAATATAAGSPTTPSLTIQHSPATAPSSASSISPTSSPQPAALAQRTPEREQEQQQQPQLQLQQLPPQTHSQSLLLHSAQRFSAFKPVTSSIGAFTSAITTTSSSFSIPNAHSSSSIGVAAPSSTVFSYLPPIGTASVRPISHHMHLLQTPGALTSNPLNAAAQIEAIVSSMGASKQGHLCIYCGKVYSRKYGLKIHIRTHTGFKPLKCKFCLRPFGDPSNLNKHVRLHIQTNANNSSTPVEGYQCTLCNKILARRRDLQRHMESRHSGEGDGDGGSS